MDTRYWTRAAAGAVAILACAFTASTVVGATPPDPKQDSLVAMLASVENVARPYPWLWTGGQPDSSALAKLAEAGVQDVFDLRGVAEPRGFDERVVARSLGLRYLPIPTGGAGDFSDSRFTAFRHHLIAHGPDRPMFVHCASGNRVGAALLPWLVLDEGVSDEHALEMAQQMGLRDPALTERAWKYIREREPAKSTK